MKLFIKILLLTIINYFFIWYWVKESDPDPSVSITLYLLVPIVVFLNLAIALILYFTKKEFTKLFVINSIISGILMYCLFLNGIDRHQKLRYESWKFEIKDTIFILTHSKFENTFSISESANSGSSTSVMDGKFDRKDNEFYLTSSIKSYKIKNGYLYGFRNDKDSIKLTKMER